MTGDDARTVYVKLPPVVNRCSRVFRSCAVAFAVICVLNLVTHNWSALLVTSGGAVTFWVLPGLLRSTYALGYDDGYWRRTEEPHV
jgi:hypothetical protein